MNVTKETGKYISSRRSIKDCLSLGLVNYSSLARLISKDLKLEGKVSNEAILIAARRYKEKLPQLQDENKLRKLLSKGELELKNKVMVTILDKYVFKEKIREFQRKVESKSDIFHLIEGSKTMTIVTSSNYHDSIKEIFKSSIVKINTDLVEIVIKSPPEIETTPGVVSYLLYLFREAEINIFELMSCWTDTILVIDQKDIAKAIELLKF